MRFGPGCLLALSGLLSASAGCGPRAGTAPAAAGPATRPAPHEPSRPEPPAEPAYEVKRVQAFALPERCSQGPLDLEVPALGVTPVERVTVVACSPRDLAGRYEIGTNGSRLQSTYGWDKADNSRCAAKAGEVKAPAAKAEPTAVPGKGKPGKAARKGKKDEPAPAPKPTSVPWTADRACPRTVSIADSLYKTPLRAGQLIRIRLWSEVPNDFEGVVFVVKQLSLGPKVTPDAWQEYLRRSDAYDQAYRAYVDKLPTCGTDAAKGKSCVHPREETRAKFDIPPPPPPRATRKPPRPSANAEWVPGYWHWAGTSWAWLAGWWRVPEADVAGNLTAKAPAAPPAVRSETRAPAPGAGLVFIPGHWMWSDGVWVWAEGGWRQPPGPGYRWHPPEWRRVPSGFVFIPGQWVR